MEELLMIQGANFAYKYLKRSRVHEIPFLNYESLEKLKDFKRKRRCWAYPVSSAYFNEIWFNYNDERFMRKYRMRRETFQFLCDALKDALVKKDTILRPAIVIEKRIAAALHLLKSNCDPGTVADLYGLGESTVKLNLKEFCDAVISILKPQFVVFPEGEQLKSVAKEFKTKWGFPDCCGALDGSHIPILKPKDFGVDYFNYKKYYSIVLMGVCDANYIFIYANVGQPGRNADSTTFSRTKLCQKLANGSLNGDNGNLHLISDAAFPLQDWLMKPFIENENTPEYQMNFNYRLSRARMTIENSFGRLKGRWRILLKRVDHSVKFSTKIVDACIVLHNICEKFQNVYFENWDDGDDIGNSIDYPQPENRPHNSNSVSAVNKRELIAQSLINNV